MRFHAFGQCSQLILDTTLQKPENMLTLFDMGIFEPSVIGGGGAP